MEPAEYEHMFKVEDHHWWFQSRLLLVRRLLEANIPKTEGRSWRLLDIGCGTGMFLERHGSGGLAYGLDFSRQALSLTRRRGIERLTCADSEAIPFAADSFDVVTAFDVMEHIEGDERVVAEVFRVLRPGGIFLATVPAHPFLWSSHDVALHHKRRYRIQQFDELFDPSLWIKRRMTYVFVAIYPIAASIRSARKLLPVHGRPSADTNLTAPWLNRLLVAWHRLEVACIVRFNAPWGLSIVTIREKRGGADR